MVKRNAKSIRVVKESLPNGQTDITQAFEPMPILYLELLENKSKVKQSLVNKEYKPDDVSAHHPTKETTVEEEEVVVEEGDERKEYESDAEYENKHDVSAAHSEAEDAESVVSDQKRDASPPGFQLDVSNADISDSASFVSRGSRISKISRYSEKSLSHKLKELLREDDEDTRKYSATKKDRKSGRIPDAGVIVEEEREEKGEKGETAHEPRKPPVPSLSELKQKGVIHVPKAIPDVSVPNLTEREEEDLKRELLFKFELLRKSYDTASGYKVPEFTMHSDYKTMQNTYQDSVRRLSLDNTVEQYKNYLIGGFMAVEFVLGNFFKLDMQGFTQQQVVSMRSYETLLIEIGEKSSIVASVGNKWPVEVRLLMMIIMNAAFFLISKLIMNKTGANIMSAINGMNLNRAGPPKDAGPRRKMKGPDMSAV